MEQATPPPKSPFVLMEADKHCPVTAAEMELPHQVSPALGSVPCLPVAEHLLACPCSWD